MGVAHRTAARLVKYGVTAGQPNGCLEMDGSRAGLVSTHSLNSIITDSAPGMACYVDRHTPQQAGGRLPGPRDDPFYDPRVEYLPSTCTASRARRSAS